MLNKLFRLSIIFLSFVLCSCSSIFKTASSIMNTKTKVEELIDKESENIDTNFDDYKELDFNEIPEDMRVTVTWYLSEQDDQTYKSYIYKGSAPKFTKEDPKVVSTIFGDYGFKFVGWYSGYIEEENRLYDYDMGVLDPIERFANLNEDTIFCPLFSTYSINEEPVIEDGYGEVLTSTNQYKKLSWKELKDNNIINVSSGVLTAGSEINNYSRVDIQVHPTEVTTIPENGFKMCITLYSFNIAGTNVSNIGQSAFYMCKALANLTLNNKVKVLKRDFINNTNIGNGYIYISSVSKIENLAFNGVINTLSGELNSLDIHTSMSKREFDKMDKETNWLGDGEHLTLKVHFRAGLTYTYK